MMKKTLAATLLASAVLSVIAAEPKLDRSKLLVGTYYLRSYAQTEQHVRDLKACGIDFVCNLSMRDLEVVLPLFEKYGVGAIGNEICPGWFGGNGKNAGRLAALHPLSEYDKRLKERFRNHPALWMVDIGDEPSALDFGTLGEVATFVKAKTGLTPYLNVYPNYAMVAKNDGKAMISQLGTTTYAEYLEQYAKKVPLDYLSYDFYVYSAPTSHPNSMIARFYENFRNAAEVCRRTKRSLWVIPQVNSRIPELWISENMLRFQANQCLAFGAEVINWACYTKGWWTNQVVDVYGRQTRQYARLKKVNAELHALGPDYMRYRNTATHLVGFGPHAGDWFVTNNWTYFKGKLEKKFDNGFFRNVRLEDGQPITVGEMVARDGSGKVALFVADAGDPWDRAPAKVHDLVFQCEGTVEAVSGKGKVAVTRDAAGLCHIALASNAGVLIRADMPAKAEPRWTLEGAAARQRISVTQGDVLAEKNRLVAFPTGSDIHFVFRGVEPFPASARPYFAMRYRALTKKTVGGLFFTTDTLPFMADKSFSTFGVTGDGAWHNVIVDMRTFGHRQWKGCVTGVRIDPLNPSETASEFDLAKAGFFPSRAAAEAFCANVDDSVAITQDVKLSGLTYSVLVPACALQNGFNRDSFIVHDDTKEASQGTMICRDGVPVPCHVNSRGFAFYRADKPGTYTRAVATDKAVPLAAADARLLGADVTTAHPRDYFTREHIRMGAWGLLGDNVWRPEKVRDLADCGIDFLIANTVDSSIHRVNLLRACNQAGIEVILTDGMASTNPEYAGMACADQPSFSGYQFSDEPGMRSLAGLGALARRFTAASGRLPFINLLPMYANAAQLTFGQQAAAILYYDADPNLYRKYCEAFCTSVDVPYISTDIYPLSFDRAGKRRVYRDYVESINVIADVARKHNREFWCYVLCYDYRPDGMRRDPTADEIRWQCYSMLSFGCRNILCWIYYHAENERSPGLVTTAGARTPAWYNTRAAFQEMHQLSDVFCRYRNLGAFTHNCTEATPYLKMTNELKNFAPIRRVTCADPLLIGCFAEKNDPNAAAFTLVNMSDLATGGTTLVTLDLAGKGVTVYRRGQPQRVTPAADGLVHIPLACCEGVFVTLQ